MTKMGSCSHGVEWRIFERKFDSKWNIFGRLFYTFAFLDRLNICSWRVFKPFISSDWSWICLSFFWIACSCLLVNCLRDANSFLILSNSFSLFSLSSLSSWIIFSFFFSFSSRFANVACKSKKYLIEGFIELFRRIRF